MALTAVRRKILENIQDGKDPYTGFAGSQLGGAIRSVLQMRAIFHYIEMVESGDPDNPFLKLTEAGAQALGKEKS